LSPLVPWLMVHQMFAILITHTSFQLWHCVFPVPYLRSVRWPPETAAPGPTAGTTATEVPGVSATSAAVPGVSGTSAAAVSATPATGVTLRCSRAYDFANVSERGAWLDVLVALVLYLRSGESKVGYLSKALGRNRLHKRPGDVDDEVEAQALEVQAQALAAQLEEDEEDEQLEMWMQMEREREIAERVGPSRKRGFETGTATAAPATDNEATPKSQRRRRA